MKQGDWPEEIIFTAEEVANILYEKAKSILRADPVVVCVESNGKRIAAFTYEFSNRRYRSVSTAQATHWVGMNK